MNSRKIKSFEIIAYAAIALLMLTYLFWNPVADFFAARKQQQTSKSLKGNLEDASKSEEQKLQEQVAEIMKTKNLSRCKEIADGRYQKVCQNNIALALAQEKKDPSYCQKMDGSLISQAQCESEVIPQKALDEKDIKVCDEATSPEVKSVCQNDFWLRLAGKEENMKECDNLAAGAGRDKCHDMYFLNAEFMTGKSTDCNQFTTEQAKKDCEIYKVILEKNITQDCPKLKTDFFQFLCRAIQ